ncbi:MAG: aminoacyl--tRNA ligase-related protein [Patescibacteria group bacterium]
MRQSQLYIPTQNVPPAEEVSRNGRLLQQAGYVDKLQAGAYTWLPLGLRVLERISTIVREEQNRIGGQEMLMPALQPKALWDVTGRWTTLRDIMYQWEDSSGHAIGLATTHEEVITDLLRRGELTYKNLPQALYQLQWKFRNEPRAKSGVLRGREFLMKDLYSFHATAEDLDTFYAKVHQAYHATFKRLGLEAHVTEASGGTFTKKHSHEFQVFSAAGEDRVCYCKACGFAQNIELDAEVAACPKCGKPTTVEKSIEVGNTFHFGDYYTTTVGIRHTAADGKRKPVYIASYGIGVSRLVGTIVEVYADAKGLVWPAAVAPFAAHVLVLGKASAELQKHATAFEQAAQKKGIAVLLDDREVSPGHKLKDADLLGMPYRVVFSERQGNNVEVTTRATGDAKVLTPEAALTLLQAV